MRRKWAIPALLSFVLLAAAPLAEAGIQVGQCVESTACYNTGASWSSNLSGAQLAALGLGSTQPFVAVQTSQFVIRLGVTTITFQTTSGPVTQTLPEFNGSGSHPDPCNACETDTVGTFVIPANATSATISGHFGNSTAGSSAGMNLFLGNPSVPTVVSVPAVSTVGLGFCALLLLSAGMRMLRQVPTSA
jgi:hypothetical protein